MAINAMNGPKTNAPVIAASTEVSWVLLEKTSMSNIPPNSLTRYPPMAANRASAKVFTGVGYGGECVLLTREGMPLLCQVERLSGLVRGRSRQERKIARIDVRWWRAGYEP